MPALLPALFVPVQLGFFGPLTVYAANVDEFAVPFWPLAAQGAWAIVVLSVVLAAAAIAMPDPWRQRFIAFLVAVGVLLWLQGNLLVADYGLLTGAELELAPPSLARAV